jgi:hypothetical protein
MNVRKFIFSFVLSVVLIASAVFAQNTHMGVPASEMVILRTFCSDNLSGNPCDTDKFGRTTSGSAYDRLLADGIVDTDFKIPERKILVITEWEWTYSEDTVLEASARDPITVMLGPVTRASVSETNLKVTDGDSPLWNQGHASAATQMTSGFVASVLPRWNINRGIVGLDSPSKRSFIIVLRGYLLDVR